MRFTDGDEVAASTRTSATITMPPQYIGPKVESVDENFTIQHTTPNFSYLLQEQLKNLSKYHKWQVARCFGQEWMAYSQLVSHNYIKKKNDDANISNETYISHNSTFMVYTVQTYFVIRKPKHRAVKCNFFFQEYI
jgi:hypothetical protein